MSFFDFIKRVLQPADEGIVQSESAANEGKQAKSRKSHPRFSLGELARRLKLTEEELRHIEPEYIEFTIPKRSGGQRQIYAPHATLYAAQRQILRKILDRPKAHPA